MGHSHGHDHHDHGRHASKKALLFSFILTAVYMIVEAAGGFITNSLALISDAGHMLSDAVSLGVALLAFKFGEKKADDVKTYGYKRFEVLAALFNGAALIVIAIFILIEAFQRLFDPAAVSGSGMLVIAIAGILLNIIVAAILMKGNQDNLNMKAALFHVFADLLGSVGAVIAALLIIFFGWSVADPIASAIVAILILISGWRVTKESVHVLMEGTPKGISLNQVIELLRSVSGVRAIHDLHVWSITNEKHALSCHAVVDSVAVDFEAGQSILREIERQMAKVGIYHVTVQLEDYEHPHENSITCTHDDD